MAGKSGVKVFDPVWVNLNGDRDVIGFVLKPEHEVDGALKAHVQMPDGGLAVVGYREPADRDEHGAGGTFWLGK